MRNCNGLLLEANQSPTAGCEWVDLIAILKEADGLVCRFCTVGGKSWVVHVKPRDLQKFVAFQRRVAEELDLWVRHSSEQEPAKLQADDWRLAVENAWRGGRA